MYTIITLNIDKTRYTSYTYYTFLILGGFMDGFKIPEGKSMASAKVGEKGQIVIPKDMRDMFGIRPGDSILLLADIERGIAIAKYDDYFAFAQKIVEMKKDDRN